MTIRRNDHLIWGLAVLLTVLAIGLAFAGCGGGALPRIQPLPAQVAMVDRDVQAVTGNLLQLLTLTARTANTISRLEDEAAKAGAVPAAADAAFDRAMVAYADASSRAATTLKAGALTSWPELKALVDPVLAKGQALVDTINGMSSFRTKVKDFLAQFVTGLLDAWGEAQFGGAR